MERIAVFGALQWECRPVLRHLRQVRRQQIDGFTVWTARGSGREIHVIKTGVGVRRAAAAARAMAGAGVRDLFLSTGCAGALTRETAPGDVVIATQMVESEGAERYDTDPPRREQARAAAQRAGLGARLGPIMCSAKVLATAEAKDAAAARTGAVAVEMEGVPIAACAASEGIPFAAVRAIFDSVDAVIDETAGFLDLDTGALKPLALARYVATRPGALPYLLAMQRMMRAAQASLDRFFAAFLA